MDVILVIEYNAMLANGNQDSVITEPLLHNIGQPKSDFFSLFLGDLDFGEGLIRKMDRACYCTDSLSLKIIPFISVLGLP